MKKLVTAPFRWGAATRDGPPLEEAHPIDVYDARESNSSGVGRPKAEDRDRTLAGMPVTLSSWTDAGEPTQMEDDLWKQLEQPSIHDIWVTQASGRWTSDLGAHGKADPRSDRFYDGSIGGYWIK